MGTPVNGDETRGVSTDGAGNVFICGVTGDVLGEILGAPLDRDYYGLQHPGDGDAFVSLYDGSGELQWTRQLRSSVPNDPYNQAADDALDVAADGAGGVYLCGYTKGDLAERSVSGTRPRGDSDAFLSKFNLAGELSWQRQIATNSSDVARSVAIGANSEIYVTGDTAGVLGESNAGSLDVFLSKFDSAGELIWTEQFGSDAGDRGYSVSTDGRGSVYVAGGTGGLLGESHAGEGDGFLSKFDDSGNLAWTRQFGSAYADYCSDVEADALGNVFIASRTNEDLDGIGGMDVVLAKYDASGERQWTRQFGRGYWPQVAADGQGNVFVSGFSLDDYDAQKAYVSKYDGAGECLWTLRIDEGLPQESWHRQTSVDVATDGLGTVYVNGNGEGLSEFGGGYAFVSKIQDVPEPGATTLLAVGMLGLLAVARRRLR